MTWQRFDLTQEACQPFELHQEGNRPSADPAPPWRQFMGWDTFKRHHSDAALKRWQKLVEKIAARPRARERANSFVLPDTQPCREVVTAVNAALALRRPLLITGLPGSGKTTLAYAVAAWLGLGPVLEWAVTPGANLGDAQASYNPLARLRELEQARLKEEDPPPVERYIRLGPVGTAFLPSHLPRVLLIDEIDKGDVNLPNQLLNLFEEGQFPIEELQRADQDLSSPEKLESSDAAAEEDADDSAQSSTRNVATWDEDHRGKPIPAPIRSGLVQCHEFPLVLMTSNGEREFPPAFNRRCLRVAMPDFSRDRKILERIVCRHLLPSVGGEIAPQLQETEETALLSNVEEALASFERAATRAHRQGDSVAVDQLLNLAFLLERGVREDGNEDGVVEGLRSVLLRALNSEAGATGGSEA